MQPPTDPAAAQQLSPAALLESAIREPGRIHAGYFAFWEYSIGNQLLAIGQCASRGITPGPLATFRRWTERGRHVRKGEKAIVLCQPVTLKRIVDKTGQPEEVAFTRFVHKASWFVLDQTEGEPFSPTPLPGWDRMRALHGLDITETQFDLLNGNVWGYARGRQLAVSPLSPLPDRTLLHEIAHIVLGHTTEGDELDGPATPRSLREVEAESVALLCAASLDLGGAEYSRGYLQHWLRGGDIPERSAQRIFKAADAILQAGRAAREEHQ
jgi:antirestriction protein ArdC